MERIIGQEEIMHRLRIWVYTLHYQNALFRGESGSGKTTIAKSYGRAIATENLYYELCAGQRLYPPGDNEPVIIDEIHRLPNEESWYDYSGVLIGCTTEGAPISEPLRSRMVPLWLAPYSLEELTQIVLQNSRIPEFVARCIASRCRGVPRLAVQLGREVKAIIDYYQYTPDSTEECNRILDSLGYFMGGFTSNDRKYLEFIKDHGPVSARVVASSLNLPIDTIEEEIEPFLFKKGLAMVTPRGRVLCGNQQ